MERRRVWRGSFCRVLVLAAIGIVGLLGIRAYSAPPTTISPEGSEALAVRRAREAQNQAIVAGDLDRVASFWTDDVSIRRALGAMLNGRAAYRQLFVDDPKTIYLRHPTHVDVATPWPLAFETGDWEGHVGSASSPSVIDGHYSAQWVKRDGHWLIRGEVFVPLHCAGGGCQWQAVP